MRTRSVALLAALAVPLLVPPATAQPTQFDREIAVAVAAGLTFLPLAVLPESSRTTSLSDEVALIGSGLGLLLGPAAGYVILGTADEALSGLWQRAVALGGAVMVTGGIAWLFFDLDDQQGLPDAFFDAVGLSLIAAAAAAPLFYLIYRDLQRIRRPLPRRAVLTPTTLRVAAASPVQVHSRVPGLSLRIQW